MVSDLYSCFDFPLLIAVLQLSPWTNDKLFNVSYQLRFREPMPPAITPGIAGSFKSLCCKFSYLIEVGRGSGLVVSIRRARGYRSGGELRSSVF